MDKTADKVEFEEFDAASATECTGLFARAPENKYEYDSYFDIMTFSPSDFKSDENSKKRHIVH